MKINFYDYFYYKLNKYLLSHSAKSSKSLGIRLGSVILISFIEETLLIVLTAALLKKLSYDISMNVLNFSLIIFLCIINGFYFLMKDRWKVFIDKYSVYDGTNLSKFMNVIIVVLVIVGFLSIIYWKIVIEWDFSLKNFVGAFY